MAKAIYLNDGKTILARKFGLGYVVFTHSKNLEFLSWSSSPKACRNYM